MKSIKIAWIIHGFAVLHLAMAWFSAEAGIGDSRLLTLMTILMTLFVCVRERATLETTCLCFVVINIAGYYLGMEVLKQFSRVTHELLSPVNQAFSSLITTEVLGWGLYSLLHFTGNTFKIEENEDEDYWDTRFKVVALFIAFIFGVRLVLGTVVSNGLFSGTDMYAFFHHYLQNYVLLLLILAVNILLLRRAFFRPSPLWAKLATAACLLLLLPCGAAFVQASGLPWQYNAGFSGADYVRELIVGFIVELLLFGLTYLVLHVLDARRRAKAERTVAHKAQFQYQNLKQQVNPHFLFNSLNTLDGLVLENRPEEASEYIHKLSGLYRYMLQNEGETLVPLRREMEYTAMFTDLLKVRFPEGLAVQTEVREEDLDRQVVPCSVQLLVENAVQHNATSASQPLQVRILSDGKVVSVENSFQPRKSRLTSHSVGQRYIRQQYKDVAGADITIVQSDTLYRVDLPLL